MNKKTWKLKDWNRIYGSLTLPLMTKKEIDDAIFFLRENHYPKPSDCPERECPKDRPACSLGICNIAIGMCGDF